MSIELEASELRLKLLGLRARGSKLLKQEAPSLEHIVHFGELVDALAGNLIETSSMESATADPKAAVRANMEGIVQVLDGIMKFLKNAGKGKKGKDAGAEPPMDSKALAEQRERLMKLYANKAWLDSAEFNEGDIQFGDFGAKCFYRGDKAISDVYNEFKKDIAEYGKMLSQMTPAIRAYTKWADETWDKLEKAYEASGKDGDYSNMTAIAKAQSDKRPPYPASKVNISENARLGTAHTDEWTGYYEWKALKTPVPIFLPEPKHKDSGKVTIVAATREQVPNILSLMSEAAELCGKAWDEFDNSGNSGGFDDYPYRDENVWEAVFEAGAEACLFDAHSTYDLCGQGLTRLSDRLWELECALYAYLKASIKTDK
jgi:hypothetical protein